jgi:hypothetical protein
MGLTTCRHEVFSHHVRVPRRRQVRTPMRQELDVSTHFGVLVESGSGKLLKRISLGLLHTGLTRVRFTLGHLKPGTYRPLIQALPPGKKPLLGPNL